MKPNINLFLSLVLALGFSWGAQTAAPFNATQICIAATTSNQPVVVFYTIEAFPIAFGSNEPVFVMYSDGTTIFRDEKPDKGNVYHFKSTQLSSAEQKQVISSLAQLKGINAEYEISRITCQPMNILSVRTPEITKHVKVCGSLKIPFNPKDPGERKALPPALNSAIDQLVHFKHAKAQAWLPEYITVEVSPYEESKEEPIKWPADWPDLNDERTQKTSYGYTILLPSSKFAALQAMMKSKPPAAAVLISGKKFLVRYRLAFPQENAINSLKG